MTLAILIKPAPWKMEQVFLSFSIILIAFLIAFALFAFGGVDLWAQTLLHSSFLLLFLYCLWHNSDSIPLIPDVQCMAIWIVLLGILGISVLRSGSPDRSQQEWWLWIDYFLVYILCARLDQAQRFGLIQSVLAVSILLCGWGWFQLLAYNQLPEGPLLNSNIFAGYLLIPLFLAAGRWTSNRSKMMGIVVLVLGGTLLITQSVGAMISLLLGGIYLGMHLNRTFRRWLLILSGIGLIAALVIAKSQASWDIHRLTWWQSCLRMALCHPFFGNGLGTFDIALPHRAGMNLFSLYAHSSWLQWLSEAGLLGTLSILITMLYALRKQTNPFYSAGLLAVFCHNWVDYSLLVPAQALLFWMIASFSSPSNARNYPMYSRSLLGKIVISLFCVSAVWQTMNRFQADRHYANAIHCAVRKDWMKANQEALISLNLNPSSSKPYALLANIALISSAPRPDRGDRGALEASLAYLFNALDHEPIQPAYWAQAMMLCTKLSLPENVDLLRDRLHQRFPFLLSDRRIQPYLR